MFSVRRLTLGSKVMVAAAFALLLGGLWNAAPARAQDPTTIAPLEGLLSGHYWRGEVGITVAPGGVGKSILSIAEALAAITGKPLLSEQTRGGQQGKERQEGCGDAGGPRPAGEVGEG